MEKPVAIEKVRLLLRLAASTPDTPEGVNAKAMADKFIAKFELHPEDYEDKEDVPIYTDDELLYETKNYEEWKSILALIVSSKYDCLTIQEVNEASTGEKVYKYFVYGDETDVIHTKCLFAFAFKEVQKVIDANCFKRGELFQSSYSEGVVNGIRINIECEDFIMEGIVMQKKDKPAENKEAMTKVEEPKEKDIPIKEKAMVNNKERPLDHIAYFYGELAGSQIHIGKAMKDLVLPENYEEDDKKAAPSAWKKMLKGIFD